MKLINTLLITINVFVVEYNLNKRGGLKIRPLLVTGILDGDTLHRCMMYLYVFVFICAFLLKKTLHLSLFELYLSRCAISEILR